MQVKSPATIEDLLAVPDDGNIYEWVDGEIVMSPAGGELVPDLVVEVLSPHDAPRHVADKIGKSLSHNATNYHECLS